MGGDGPPRTGRLSRLAAPREVLLRAARPPPVLLRRRGRRAALPCPVPRAPSDRARPTVADGPAGGNAVMRPVERHRTRRPAGVPRSHSTQDVGQRSAREGPPAHARGLPAARAPAEADDRPVSSAVPAVRRSAANAGDHSGGARRREGALRCATPYLQAASPGFLTGLCAATLLFQVS